MFVIWERLCLGGGKLYTLVSVYILILRLIGDIGRVVSIRLEYLIITTGYCCIVAVISVALLIIFNTTE